MTAQRRRRVQRLHRKRGGKPENSAAAGEFRSGKSACAEQKDSAQEKGDSRGQCNENIAENPRFLGRKRKIAAGSGGE